MLHFLSSHLSIASSVPNKIAEGSFSGPVYQCQFFFRGFFGHYKQIRSELGAQKILMTIMAFVFRFVASDLAIDFRAKWYLWTSLLYIRF